MRRALKWAGILLLVLVIGLVLVARRRLERENTELKFRMWLFPYLTGVVMLFILAVLILMVFDNDQRQAIIFSAISAMIIVSAGFIVQRRSRYHSDDEGAQTRYREEVS